MGGAADQEIVATIAQPSLDPQGLIVSYRYSWSADGKVVEGLSGPKVAIGKARKGQSWEVAVVASNGKATTAPVKASWKVQNTAPTVGKVSLQPANPVASQGVSCQAAGADADGDKVTLEWTWTVGGRPVPSSGPTLAAGAGKKGEVVRCTAVPFDGEVRGAPAVGELTIANAPPVAGKVVLSPQQVDTNGMLSCAPEGFSDPDGDPLTYKYGWTVGGVAIGVETATLSGDRFDKNARVACSVIATDGAAQTGVTFSPAITVIDSPPTLAKAELGPLAATRSQALTCTPSGAVDIDNDKIGYAVTWVIDGARNSSQVAATLPAGTAKKGQKVQCLVAATDGRSKSEPVASGEVVIQDSPPSLGSAVIGPAAPMGGATLTCTAVGPKDPDGDTVQSDFRWTVDGADVARGPTLTGPAVRKGAKVSCTAEPTDGQLPGPSVTSATIVVKNSPPSAVSAQILPESPATGDKLTCTGSGMADPDGDPVTVKYAWRIDGSTVQGLNSDTLLHDKTRKGQRIECGVIPNDGEVDGKIVMSKAVVIVNTPPVMGGVDLVPGETDVTGNLTCKATGATDDDRDALTIRYGWRVDGQPVPGGNMLYGTSFKRGQKVSCEGTVTDGTVTSAVTQSDVITVKNAVPRLSGATISPATATAGSVLTCNPVGAADPDGDVVESDVRWLADGAEIGRGPKIEGPAVKKGRVITCTATPTDRQDVGKMVTSGPVTVKNSLPTVTSATLGPVDPDTTEVLTCTAAGASDLDGDAVALRWRWKVDGSTSEVTTQTFPAEKTRRGQKISCEAIPFDGEASGAAVGAAVITVQNTAPTMGAVTLTPAEVDTNSTVSCKGADVSDIDGDSVSIAYKWLVDGQAAGTSSTLSGSAFSKGQKIGCEANPTDGSLPGPAGRSADVIVKNSPPKVSGASISPTSPTATSTITCTPGGVSDADGDKLDVRFAWTVSGVAAATSTNTLSGSFRRDDKVACEVTVFDGEVLSAPAKSSPVTVLNTTPKVTRVEITGDAFVGATLRASVTDEDADNDPVELRYEWTVDGNRAQATGDTLPGDGRRKGQKIQVRVTPTDGKATGASVSSAVVVVQNSPPGLVKVEVPTPRRAHAEFQCNLAQAATDPDGDAVSYRVNWYVGGEAVPASGVRKGVFDGDVLLATSARPGVDLTCKIAAFDGTIAGPAGQATVRTMEPQIAAGSGHTCVLHVDGSVACFGSNAQGQGDLPRQLRFSQLSGGGWHTCGLLTDGHVNCWGYGNYGQTQAPGDAFVAVAAGGWHSCGVRASDRSVSCWGQDTAGQTKAPAGRFLAVAAGGGHSCGILEGGALSCWGDNSDGQSTPPGGSFAKVTAGEKHSCGIRNDGSLACWGRAAEGETAAPAGSFEKVSAGGAHTCAVDSQHQVRCWGRNDFGQTAAPAGQFFEIDAAQYNTCAWTGEGTVVCWGRDNFGQSAPTSRVWDLDRR